MDTEEEISVKWCRIEVGRGTGRREESFFVEEYLEGRK
jgi:hypothetical protein